MFKTHNAFYRKLVVRLSGAVRNCLSVCLSVSQSAVSRQSRIRALICLLSVSLSVSQSVSSRWPVTSHDTHSCCLCSSVCCQQSVCQSSVTHCHLGCLTLSPDWHLSAVCLPVTQSLSQSLGLLSESVQSTEQVALLSASCLPISSVCCQSICQ